ncbi:MAG: bifunctional 4-hydroxy-2-oxoglutarate aldolase/2-dehydro-3-deoxy-phosphogluconate aldolase, partial [Bacteroidota bacterium]|nr:bifunctional 4-hydroxy-2-oxoglutarate aldolase/2-dehydro-3-deoxy-phosphogluconate aldolase [Bacteroidota bacterium]
WTSIMPTGGVDTSEANLKAWFSAGVTCVGMGSQLISKEILEKRDFMKLTATVKEVLGVIQGLMN